MCDTKHHKSNTYSLSDVDAMTNIRTSKCCILSLSCHSCTQYYRQELLQSCEPTCRSTSSTLLWSPCCRSRVCLCRVPLLLVQNWSLKWRGQCGGGAQSIPKVGVSNTWGQCYCSVCILSCAFVAFDTFSSFFPICLTLAEHHWRNCGSKFALSNAANIIRRGILLNCIIF